MWSVAPATAAARLKITRVLGAGVAAAGGEPQVAGNCAGHGRGHESCDGDMGHPLQLTFEIYTVALSALKHLKLLS